MFVLLRAESIHRSKDLALLGGRVQHPASSPRPVGQFSIRFEKRVHRVDSRHELDLFLDMTIFTARDTVEAVGEQDAHSRPSCQFALRDADRTLVVQHPIFVESGGADWGPILAKRPRPEHGATPETL